MVVSLLMSLVSLGFLAFGIYVAVLVVRALRLYLRSADARREKDEVKKTLGEAIKAQRTKCGMTQEFVAESLGVSRQAVSKWENGTSDPATSNLLALAKLFGISAQELLREVTQSGENQI